MKSFIITALLAISTVQAIPAYLTANFDSLHPQTTPGTNYTENGITFTSPTQFGVVSGLEGADLFGWGGYSYQGSALYVENGGWVCITSAGMDMLHVAFSGGFDWNGFAIAYGQLDVYFEWCAMKDGQQVASAIVPLAYPGRQAHQFGASVTPGTVFDELMVRTTAVGYTPDRTIGSPVTFGSGGPLKNSLAFDNVRVERVPDTGNPIALFALTLALLAFYRRN